VVADFRMDMETRHYVQLVEDYRREIIQDVRDGVTGHLRRVGFEECSINTVLRASILQLEDPLDPRAVAAAEDLWKKQMRYDGEPPLYFAKTIDRHFKEKP
jgi:hypothetical protein